MPQNLKPPSVPWMTQPTFPVLSLDDPKQRHVVTLLAAGILCLGIAIWEGGSLFGRNLLGISPLLFRIGLMYVTFTLFVYNYTPTSVREALLGAICASGVVFLVGTAGMYYEITATASPDGTPLRTPYILAYQAAGVLLTLPISSGWVAGTLISLNKPFSAIVGMGGASVCGGLGASQLLIALYSASGSAAGFIQVGSFIAVVATAGLALLLPISIPGRLRESVSVAGT